jgi:hypothetical protein
MSDNTLEVKIQEIPTVELTEKQMESRLSSLKKKKRIPFWSENPNVLFQTAYIGEFFPVEYMSYEQKLNAVSRTVIVLTLISFAYSQKIQVVGICALSLFLIFLMFYFHKQNNEKRVRFDESKEGFGGGDPDPKVFDVPDSGNPLSNVLLPDYDYNPNKKPAPPAFTKLGGDSILKNAKKMVQEANPDQPNISEKLFANLGEELKFEQSIRPFYSTASTTIPNDQSAFADFCYGSMVSCKEGNMFACVKDNGRYNNY